MSWDYEQWETLLVTGDDYYASGPVIAYTDNTLYFAAGILVSIPQLL